MSIEYFFVAFAILMIISDAMQWRIKTADINRRVTALEQRFTPTEDDWKDADNDDDVGYKPTPEPWRNEP